VSLADGNVVTPTYFPYADRKTMSENSKLNQEKLQSIGLAVLRISVGGMMLTHGWPKLGRLMETPDRFADPIGLGPEISLGLTVLAEFVCSVLIMAGAATRYACAPLLVTMLVAAFIVHGDDPFNDKELALLYAAGTLTLIFTGPGRYSLDAYWKSKPVT